MSALTLQSKKRLQSMEVFAILPQLSPLSRRAPIDAGGINIPQAYPSELCRRVWVNPT